MEWCKGHVKTGGSRAKDGGVGSVVGLLNSVFLKIDSATFCTSSRQHPIHVLFCGSVCIQSQEHYNVILSVLCVVAHVFATRAFVHVVATSVGVHLWPLFRHACYLLYMVCCIFRLKVRICTRVLLFVMLLFKFGVGHNKSCFVKHAQRCLQELICYLDRVIDVASDLFRDFSRRRRRERAREGRGGEGRVRLTVLCADGLPVTVGWL